MATREKPAPCHDVEFRVLAADQEPRAWDEAAAFLSSAWARAFTSAALRWEFRHGFLLTAWRAGTLVGTQGFVGHALRVGRRATMSAKSERTLLATTERGTGLFEALYERAVALAAERLGAELVWGLTAIPQAFEKLGYEPISNVYTHSLLPLAPGGPGGAVLRAVASLAAVVVRPCVAMRLRSGVLLPAREIPVTEAVRPILTDDFLAWCADDPDTSMVIQRQDEDVAVFTIDRLGIARLRCLECVSVARMGPLLADAMARLRAAGAGTLRLTWNAASPTGRALAALLCRTPYPYRRGAGHFCWRPLTFRDHRLCGHREAWELMGWEDLIHQP
jgi:hypothetical protein